MDTNGTIPTRGPSHDEHSRYIPAPSMPDHDDGLVHDHGWACSERGSKAHR